HHVASLTTLNAPWQGAPKLDHVMATGQFLDDLKLDTTTGVVGFPTGVGLALSQALVLHSTIKAIVGSLAGAHELAPSGTYYDLVSQADPSQGGLFGVVDPTTQQQETPVALGENSQRVWKNYDDTIKLLNDSFGRVDTGKGFFPGTDNKEFHSVAGQDDWTNDKSGVQYTIIRS